jgi:hypothetical protein
MNVICPHHKIIHITISHVGCMRHGHCLNPTCCPLWESCPCNVYNEKDEESEEVEYMNVYKQDKKNKRKRDE